MSDSRPAGRTVIASRAIEKIVRAATAEQFGVDAGKVGASLADQAGGLDISVRTPIRVVSISRALSDPGSVDRAGGTIVDRAASGESALIEQISSITGSTVAALQVRFTEAAIRQERRVR